MILVERMNLTFDSDVSRKRESNVKFVPLGNGDRNHMADQSSEPEKLAADEIDLGELLAAMRRQARLIVLFAVAAVALAIVYLHIATPQYRVTLKVTPVQGSARPMGTGANNLASLAGISVPMDQRATDFELYLEGIFARETSVALAAHQTLLRRVFAREWSSARNDWVRPHGAARFLLDMLKRLLGVPTPKWTPPDGARLQEYLVKHIDITRDKESPVVGISFEHTEPALGRDLLWAVHRQVDDMLRQRTIDRTTSYIAYLNERLAATNVADYRAALVQALAEQEKMRMMASSDLAFAAEPFGMPVASMRPTKPNALFLLVFAFGAGLAIGIVAAVFRDILARR